MKKLRNKFIIIIFTFIMIIPLTSCGDETGEIISGNQIPGSNNTVESDLENLPDGSTLYIVVSIDTEKQKIIVDTIGENKKIVLSYTGGTRIQNRYNEEISISRLKIGEIVELEYKRGTQKLTSIKVSDTAWEYSDVTSFTIDTTKKILTTGNQKYTYDSKIKVFSNDLEIGIDEINELDEITLKGYGTKIYSIIVTKGHGYIVLENTENFVGGMIDIGSEIITEIKNGMVIVAPEGSYVLTVTKSGSGGSMQVNILRDAEINVDVSRLQTPLEMGSVKFNIVPTSAKLYVDGTFVSYKDPISLSYGTHSFRITATGYNTLIGKISINKSYTSQSFNMNITQTTTVAQTTTSNIKQQIKVTDPAGVVVYFDNVNKGTSPVSFDAVVGSHTIVLRKTGYLSKSYTVNIPDDGKDVDFSFDDLVAAY